MHTGWVSDFKNRVRAEHWVRAEHYVQNTIGKVKEEKKKSKSNNKKMKEIMKNDKE